MLSGLWRHCRGSNPTAPSARVTEGTHDALNHCYPADDLTLKQDCTANAPPTAFALTNCTGGRRLHWSDRTGQDRTEQDKAGQDWTGLDRTGQDWTGLDRTGQDWTGLEGTGQDSATKAGAAASRLLAKTAEMSQTELRHTHRQN